MTSTTSCWDLPKLLPLRVTFSEPEIEVARGETPVTSGGPGDFSSLGSKNVNKTVDFPSPPLEVTTVTGPLQGRSVLGVVITSFSVDNSSGIQTQYNIIIINPIQYKQIQYPIQTHTIYEYIRTCM